MEKEMQKQVKYGRTSEIVTWEKGKEPKLKQKKSIGLGGPGEKKLPQGGKQQSSRQVRTLLSEDEEGPGHPSLKKG